MFPSSNRGAGMNMGFPDVCLTPAGPAMVPVPYPNIAMNAQAVPFSPFVFLSGMNALNMASKIPMTSGDEAGVGGPFIKMMGGYTMGNPVVSIDGLPGINLLCPTTGNNMNNPLGAVTVPSVTNVFFCLAEGPPPVGPVDGDALDRIAAALDDARPVEAAMLGGDVALLAVRVFTTDLARPFHVALQALLAEGASSIVIDLRKNPGGDLEAARRLADDFLDEGAVIASYLDADGDEVTLRARQGDPITLPVVLLVDAHTASAAEVFAHALQTNGRALVVGERTHGKGSAQALRHGLDGAPFYADVARFPDLAGRGVSPDLEASPALALSVAAEAARSHR